MPITVAETGPPRCCARPVVVAGLVSYSAYLWHWPLMAFWRYGYRDIIVTSGLVLFVLTFVLAWFTYCWVEGPARRATASAWRVALGQFAAPAALVAMFCLVAMKLDGLTFRPQDRESLKPVYAYDYVCEGSRITAGLLVDRRCVTGMKGVEPSVLLWGDSNAAHYVGMVSVLAERARLAVRNVQAYSCPPVEQDPQGMVDAKRLDDCRASQAIVLPAVDAYPVVVLAGSWTGYAASALDAVTATAQRLAQRGHAVVLLGKSPVLQGYDRDCEHKARAFPGGDCPKEPLPNLAAVSRVNAVLRDFADRTEGVEYFDPNHLLCPEGMCPLRNAKGDVVYFDSSHLTMQASWELGRDIVRASATDPILIAASMRGAAQVWRPARQEVTDRQREALTSGTHTP